jgi:hypothetical protein
VWPCLAVFSYVLIYSSLSGFPQGKHEKYDKPEHKEYKPEHKEYKPEHKEYKPDGYKPDGYKPDGYKPDGYKPDGYKVTALNWLSLCIFGCFR